MYLEQPAVVEGNAFLVSKMNTAIEKRAIRYRLGADERSSGRYGNFIDLRHSACNQNQNWHNQHCEPFSRHLASGALRDAFLSHKISTATRIGGKDRISSLVPVFRRPARTDMAILDARIV